MSSDRRVLFIPTTFGCEPAKRANTGAGAKSTLTLHTDYLTVECHIRGIDFADAVAIRLGVLNSVRTVMRANSQALDGLFPSQVNSKPVVEWEGQGRILQRFTWELQVERIERTYLAHVKEIDIVDRTQITSVDGALTPDAETQIKE